MSIYQEVVNPQHGVDVENGKYSVKVGKKVACPPHIAEDMLKRWVFLQKGEQVQEKEGKIVKQKEEKKEESANEEKSKKQSTKKKSSKKQSK